MADGKQEGRRPRRYLPNILVTGTPGVGKTTFCEALVDALNNALPAEEQKREAGSSSNNVESVSSPRVQIVRVGQVIKEHRLYQEWDDTLNVPIFDEDMLYDHLVTLYEDGEESADTKGSRRRGGGLIMDFHSAEFLPASWFDLVIVLRASTQVLYDRLQKRGYAPAKVQENVESEIFQVVKDSVEQAFGDHVEIWEKQNNTLEEMEALVDQLVTQLVGIARNAA